MKFNILIFLFLLISYNSYSQEFISEEEATGENDLDFWDKTFFGGDFGLMFGNTMIIITSPEMGYVANDRLAIGGGIIYEYYAVDRFSTSIYGGKIFSKFFIFENVYAIGILETVSFENFHNSSYGRYWFTSPLIGVGYMQKFGGNSGIGLSLLYNLNDDVRSPYYRTPMPIIRMSFAI